MGDLQPASRRKVPSRFKTFLANQAVLGPRILETKRWALNLHEDIHSMLSDACNVGGRETKHAACTRVCFPADDPCVGCRARTISKDNYAIFREAAVCEVLCA